MGNPLGSTASRWIIFGALTVSVTLSVIAFMPKAKQILASRSTYRISYYVYNPEQPVVSEVDTSRMPPAIAVPILMYHGVREKEDDANTTIKNFISHMEMLKRKGYETISIKEYDLFRQGKSTLPPKPIIITFDDGRKDSYYTTDDVLRKLGFKATIFVASGMAATGNTFYLTWDELKQMKETERWDIQAHGRFSHERIPIVKNPKRDLEWGRYLTSKLYLTNEDRLETVEEFERRVESDYLANIEDLKRILGIRPEYFAIPLNDYGQQPISNYDQAVPFNYSLISKYFRLAFIQANSSDDPRSFHLPIYNFADDDPYQIKRIEVKNMSTVHLERILETQRPVPPWLDLKQADFASVPLDPSTTAGIVFAEEDGLHLAATEAGRNGQVVFGETYWNNYTTTAQITRDSGRSQVFLFHYKDSRNYLSLGFTDKGYFLRSTMNGVTKDLRPPRIASSIPSELIFSVVVKNDRATCTVNGVRIFTDVPLPLTSGAVGYKVWNDTRPGSGVLHSLELKRSEP